MAFQKTPTIDFWSTSLNGAINDSVDTITLNSTTNLQAPGRLIINRQDSVGANTPSSREVISFTGISGSDITGVTRGADNSTARSHADGSLVESAPSVGWSNDNYAAIVAEHNTDGTHSDITADSVTSKIIPRVTTITSHATPTINTDNCDVVTITALGEAITSMTTNLSGTPVNFQKLIFRILDDGTARAITWGASFEARGVDLPLTTTANKLLTVGFIYDTVDSIWGCVAISYED